MSPALNGNEFPLIYIVGDHTDFLGENITVVVGLAVGLASLKILPFCVITGCRSSSTLNNDSQSLRANNPISDVDANLYLLSFKYSIACLGKLCNYFLHFVGKRKK